MRVIDTPTIFIGSLFLLSGCALTERLEELPDELRTISLAPTTTATFTSIDRDHCSQIPVTLDRNAGPFPLFVGLNQSGVGYSGRSEPRDGHSINSMHAAFQFDTRGIPRSSADTVLARLLFVARKSPGSFIDECPTVPIGRVQRVTVPWNTTTNFFAPLAGAPISNSSCQKLQGNREGGLYECNVTIALQNMVRNPSSFPNEGLAVHPPTRDFDSCSTKIGPPGNRLECAASLSHVVLEIKFLPQ